MDIDKISSGIIKGVKKAADGIAKGTQLAANGVAAGVQKTAETIKSNNQKKIEREELRKEIQEELKKEKLAETKQRANSAANSAANSPQYVICEPKNSGMKLLFPDCYTELQVKKKPGKKQEKELLQDVSFYQKIEGNCDAQILIFRTTEEKAMDFNDEQGLIDKIHHEMADNQGLICVNTGTTKRGYSYIYSIVKTLKDGHSGVLYFLRMNLKKEDSIVEIQASFDEFGMTGEREAIAGIYAMNLGLYSIEDEKMIGWSEDPYDASYTRGIPMNLSERVGLDGLFPGNPLSQAREFVLAVTQDELVLIKKEEDSEEKETEKSEFNESSDNVATDEQKKKQSDELLKSLFEKSDKCRRYTYPVEIK